MKPGRIVAVVSVVLAVYWAAMVSARVRETRRELRRIENAMIVGLQTHGVSAGDRELLRILREERSAREQRARRAVLPPLEGMGVQE